MSPTPDNAIASPADEDLDQVGPRDPVARFTLAAVQHDRVRPGDKLDQNMVDYAYAVVKMAAGIGGLYGDGDFGNSGKHIRAELGNM